MRVLVFGGTTEGRELAARMPGMAEGLEVTVSVATALGAEELRGLDAVAVCVGRLDQPAMGALLSGFDLCVDATHPYASEATRTIAAACAQTGVPLKRLLRAASFEGEACDDVTVVASCAEAAAFLAHTAGNVLLTTGSKELAAFGSLIAADPGRVYARVLPTHEGIATCEAVGLPHRNIVALQGPFGRALNEALFVQYAIAWTVTKDGGAPGGFDEKLAAARACGVHTVVVRRPPDAGEDLDAVLTWVRAQAQ